MREDTAYNIMKGFGTDPEQAAAISKIFGVEEDTPAIRERLVHDIEKTGMPHEAAALLVDIFLERQQLQ